MNLRATRGRVGLTVGLAVLAIALLVRVAASEPVEMWHDPLSRGERQLDSAQTSNTLEPSTTLPGEQEPSDDDLPAWVDFLIVAVLAAGVAFALVWLLRRRRRRRLFAMRFFGDSREVPDDARLPLIEASEESIALLAATGTPRNAIVACWVRLEDAVERAGLDRSPAETSTEFARRVLLTYDVDQLTIEELAALYREARFSEHELAEHHRPRAIAAFNALAGHLRRRATEEVGVTV